MEQNIKLYFRGRSTGKIFPIGNNNATINDIQGPTTNTLTSRYEGIGNGSYIIENKQPTQEIKTDGEPMFTLTSQDRHGVMILDDTKSERFGGGKMYDICPTLRSSRYGHKVIKKNDYRIRKLTPKECFRLQGFPDEYFERASQVNSDSQLYKQAGNSVTVNVIYEIAKKFEIERSK